MKQFGEITAMIGEMGAIQNEYPREGLVAYQ
jgi:hypothetical protein